MRKLYFIFLSFAFFSGLNAQVIWSESFESGDFGMWQNIDGDGDGNLWAIGEAPLLVADGTFCVTSASWNANVGPLNPNNYLISPPIDLSGASGTVLMDWQAYGQDQTWANENYKVVASLDGSRDGMDNGTVLYDGIVGASGGAYVTETGNLSDFAGELVFIGFVHYNVTDQFQLNIDAIEIYTSSEADVSVTEVVTPNNSAGCELTDAETVSVLITNNGGADITNFEVGYSVNGGATVSEMVTAVIAPAGTLVYEFSTTADLSALGEYEIEVVTNLADDVDLTNNTATGNLRHSDSQVTVHVVSDASGGHAWTITDNATGQLVGSRGAYQWNLEFFDDVCIYSDRCYTFSYVGQMGPGAYLEILLDGQPILGDTDGLGIPAELTFTSIGGGCAPNEASASSVTTERYSLLDSDVNVAFDYQNLGSAAISEITASYTVDGGAPISQTFTGLNIAQAQTGNAVFDMPINLDEMVVRDIVVTIETVNGVTDDATNNVTEGSIIPMTEIPNRSFVIEEGTGTWCPWCPRGAVGLQSITAMNEDAIGIAVHNSDPMDLGTFDDQTLELVGAFGYPFGAVNRTRDVDPGAVTLIEAYASEKLITVPAALDGEAVYDPATNMVTVDVDATIFAAIMPGAYTINVILTEDGVTGTGDAWAQANNYAGGGQGPMGGYETLPNPVPAADMVYDHVARMYMGDFEGDLGSFPTDATFEDTPSYTYSAQASAEWDITEMHAVAMLIESSTRRIVNAVSLEITSLPTSNVEVVQNDNIRVFPNPFKDQVNIELDIENAEDVSIMVYNTLGALVAQRSYGELQGKNILPFNGHNLEAGMYSVNILIGNKLTSKKVVLSK